MDSKATYNKVSEHPAQKLFCLNSFQYKVKTMARAKPFDSI